MSGKSEGLAQADITYDAIGRPTNVTVLAEPESDACKELARALFDASWAPPQHVPEPRAPERLWLFLDKETVTLWEENQFAHWPMELDQRGAVVPRFLLTWIGPGNSAIAS